MFPDLKYALRQLVKRPGFAVVALATLALGIGAVTAMFTVVNGVLLRPLPYPEADRVVSVWTRYVPSSGYDFPQFPLSGPEFFDYRNQSRALAQVAAFQLAGATLSTGDEPERVILASGTASLFTVLGVQPLLGRGFAAGEDLPGAACVAVLSQGLWMAGFGGDSDAVGRVFRLDGAPCEIVGVMPGSFVFPDARARLWRNLILDPAAAEAERYSHNLRAIGRLASGATPAEAEAEMSSLMAGWAEAIPEHYTGHFLIVRRFLDDVVGNVRLQLLTLLGAAGLVLLMVCASLANLLLARGEARRRELGVRLALGAGRGRIVTHVFAESVVLAATGGVLGVVTAGVFLDGLLALYPGRLPRAEAIGMDWRVFVFATVASGLAAVLFGFVPARRVASGAPRDALATESRGATGNLRGVRLRQGLVAVQTAISLTLVAGAGLLLRTFGHLQAVDLGFAPDQVQTLALALPSSSYPTNASTRTFYGALLDRLQAVPGVAAAGLVSNLPLVDGSGGLDDFIIEGRSEPAPGERRWNAGYVLATPGYFETLRVPVLRGRVFERSDHRDAPWVAVINEAAARTYWPDQDPIGRRVRYQSPDTTAPPAWLTIVGVVKTARANGPQIDPRPQIFVPQAQLPRDGYPGRFMRLVWRGAGSAPMLPAIRSIIREADPGLALIDHRPMDDLVSDSLGQPKFTSFLVTFFASVALVLGALGIYGVLAYAVTQRTRELGIRLALGAYAGDVRRLVLRQGMRPVLIGIGGGLVGALMVTGLIRDLLFGVRPDDPIMLGATTLVLGGTALLACYLPARRAAKLDPMIALRLE